MPTDIEMINLKVLIMDVDYYAMQSVNSYLAWDRRTRVTHLVETLDELWDVLTTTLYPEQPDVVLLAAEAFPDPAALASGITRIHTLLPKGQVMVMTAKDATDPSLPSWALAAARAGARGVLLKGEIRLQIAWAIVVARGKNALTTTQGVARAAGDTLRSAGVRVHTLPEQRHYPELTDRVRQAIQLCVVEGMPAHLAAHEMGISLHTVRGYVKEGYRIMEAHDNAIYPADMTPQERAFMRFTAFEEDGVAS